MVRPAAQAQFASADADYCVCAAVARRACGEELFSSHRSFVAASIAQGVLGASDELLRLAQERFRIGAGR
jgi:hypothetical protein